jgi:hypothetical protein
MKEQMRRMERGELKFFRVVAGYGMSNVKRNENVREEMVRIFGKNA